MTLAVDFRPLIFLEAAPNGPITHNLHSFKFGFEFAEIIEKEDVSAVPETFGISGVQGSADAATKNSFKIKRCPRH